MFLFGNLFLAVGKLLSFACTILIWMIIIRAVLSWFSVSVQYPVVRFLIAITNPILDPIRRVMPQWEFDISPIIAIIALWFIDMFLAKSLVDVGIRLASG
jgi:YggT family protein